jgi:hypothetical protein
MNHPGRRPPPRLDRRAAEQLLRRDPSARNVHPGLAEILESAAAPGRADELTGRPAAVAAFRSGRHSATRPPYRVPVRSGLARLLGLKAVAVFAAAAATGGVTLAAATGTLHVPSDLPGSSAPGSSAPPATSPAGGPLVDSPRAATPTGTPSPTKSCVDFPRPTGDAPPPQQGGQQPQQGAQPGGEPRPPDRDLKPVACGSTLAPTTNPPMPGPTFDGGPTFGGGGPPAGGGDCKDRCPPKTGGPTFGG